ncbi:MAG: iron ABC transporter permease [Gammaproteobacteria bacterium]|nr:iron ABC transporter permease [Gammaproteobacteria bacterium]
MSAVTGSLPTPVSGRPGRRYWSVAAFLIALPTLASLVIIVLSLLHPDSEILGHLFRYVLPRVTANTIILVAGVSILAGVIGIGLGWLTAMYDFPGRRIFSWALLLPMAMPGYVMAFVAIGLLEYSGPVQTLVREWTGAEPWFPPIRSTGGIIVVMSLALYPYVYLLSRNAFLTQGRQALEVGQSLGLNRRQGFFRVALPMARPWIAGGLMLVVMETLADFGTVSVFNYDTFTTAIYSSWFGLYSVSSALQLAFFLLVLVFVAVVLEHRLRGRAAYTAGLAPGTAAIPLAGIARWIAFLAAFTVLFAGFLLPCLQLLVWIAATASFDQRYLAIALRTVLLSASAAVLIGVVAVILVYSLRNAGNAARFAGRIATLGYALPGTVLAVGIYTQLAGANHFLNEIIATLTGVSPRLFLQGTVLAMLLAYLIRFLAVAFQSVDAAMQRITRRIDESARSLGVGGWQLLRQVHVPLLRGGLLTALILVFVDVMKEMPITLMTRPFGWDTLAVRVYEMTAEGMWQQAALPALSIVLAGVVPVILIVRASAHAPATR